MSRPHTCPDCGELLLYGSSHRNCPGKPRPAEEEGVLEPFTDLLAAAISLHEMFRSFREAGFSEQQALYLVGQAVRPEGHGA